PFARALSVLEFDYALPVIATANLAQFLLENWQHGSVELLCLRHTHAMNLEADDVEAGARKNFNDSTRPQVWKFEIIRLNQHKRLLDLCGFRESDHPIEKSTIDIGKFRPEFQIAFNRFGLERCHCPWIYIVQLGSAI